MNAVTGAQPVAYFNSRPVLSIAPNWAETPEATFNNEADKVDFAQGSAIYTHPQFTRETWQLTFLDRGKGEGGALQDFFARACGRLREFYMPTGDSDFNPQVSSLASDTSLRIKGQYFELSQTRHAVWLEMYTGEKWAIGVASKEAVNDGEGADTVIHFSDKLPRPVEGSEVTRISWLVRCRFASDTLTETLLTDDVASLSVSVQTLDDP